MRMRETARKADFLHDNHYWAPQQMGSRDESQGSWLSVTQRSIRGFRQRGSEAARPRGQEASLNSGGEGQIIRGMLKLMDAGLGHIW